MTDRIPRIPPRKTADIDWDLVHRRLANARATVDQGWSPSREEQQQILKARAQAAAQEPPPDTVSADHLEIVHFELAHEQYGIASSSVREIYPLTNLTPLPCTPAFVLGIINVRGRILSIIDIKKLFELPDKGLTDLNKVVIIQDQALEVGILADVILGVRTLSRKDIQPPPPTFTGIRALYLTGVTKERVVILDAAKLLSDKSIMVHEEVGTSTQMTD